MARARFSDITANSRYCGRPNHQEPPACKHAIAMGLSKIAFTESSCIHSESPVSVQSFWVHRVACAAIFFWEEKALAFFAQLNGVEKRIVVRQFSFEGGDTLIH